MGMDCNRVYRRLGNPVQHEPKVGMCGRICNIMHWGRSEISIRITYKIFNLFLRNSGAWLLINVNVSKA